MGARWSISGLAEIDSAAWLPIHVQHTRERVRQSGAPTRSDCLIRFLTLSSNKVRRAYNRNIKWDERVELMSWYADYLDELRGQTA